MNEGYKSPGPDYSRRDFLKKSPAILAADISHKGESESVLYKLIPSGGEVVSSRSPDGSIKYKHSDPQTNHILNVLTGLEKLSLDDIQFLLRAKMNREKKGTISGITNLGHKKINIEDVPNEELTLYYLNNFLTKNRVGFYGFSDRAILDTLKIRQIPLQLFFPLKPFEKDREFYNLIWELEMIFKNIRLRFSSKVEDGKGGVSRFASFFGKNRFVIDGGVYVVGNNTLFLEGIPFGSWLVLLDLYREHINFLNKRDKEKANKLADVLADKIGAQLEFESDIRREVYQIIIRFEGELNARINKFRDNMINIYFRDKLDIPIDQLNRRNELFRQKIDLETENERKKIEPILLDKMFSEIIILSKKLGY